MGIDYGMFKGKLYGGIDVYHKYTTKALMNVNISSTYQGKDAADVNIGELLNKGIELTLGSNIKITDKISWSGNF